jgi:hypothetical protein
VLTARHKAYEAYQRITLTSVPATKMTAYGDLLRAMTDQLAFIAEPSHTPSHPRVVCTPADGFRCGYIALPTHFGRRVEALRGR